MKRNQNLVVFSHEHHHGLVFCNRLEKANQTDNETIKSFVQDFWDNHLEAHFQSEEKLLLPLLGDREIFTQFLSDHDQIRKLVQYISGKSKGAEDEALNLSKRIRDHIRFEERIMFPWLEKALPPDQLAAIGKALEGTEISAHYFSSNFWRNEN